MAKKKVPPEVREFLAKIGRKGGKRKSARKSENARRAARIRWERVRAQKEKDLPPARNKA